MNNLIDSLKVLIGSFVVGVMLAQPANAALCKISPTGMQDYTQYPLFQNTNVPPVSLLALSIDHQLFNKAYTDYTNLDADPEIETTYDNEVNYSGYFDSKICYAYVGARYEASVAAINKKCTGLWSGNFLNWVTMTRLDVLRWVLYGGNRSIDSLTETELERAHIPQDGHSYTKIFAGNSTAAVNEVTPFASTYSFCNTTSSNLLSQTTPAPPVIQAAPGAWPTWTLVERYQCDFGRNSNTPPAAGSSVYNVRVKVCGSGVREDFCRTYPGSTGPIYKPAGLLQEYGEVANGIEFGLMSGSYDRPRSGGVLRSNVGRISNEIDQTTGLFTNQTNGTAGIINSISRIRVSQYTRDDWDDCNTPAIRNDQLTNTRGLRKCNMWGNPIGEIYAEALRYFANQTRTAAFDADDAGGNPAYIVGMPKATWVDPFRNRPRCTACSIIVLSTGLNSFDRDEIPAVSVLGASTVAQATDVVGANEGVGGNTLIGEILTGTLDTTAAANASNRVCSSKAAVGLSGLSGICPEVGSLQGGYDIAGLAHKAFINDLRPEVGLEGKQNISTYTLSLAESLPSIKIPVGTGEILVLPFTKTNVGSSSIVNFNLGFLVGPVAAADLTFCRATPNAARCNFFGIPAGNSSTAGSFVINWEDSTWGNDYDQDGVQVLSYCVGSACTAEFCKNTDVSSYAGTIAVGNRACEPPLTFDPGKLYLRSELVQTATGIQMQFGWVTAGSDAAGVEPGLIKGNRNCNFLGGPIDITCGGQWTRPQVRAYSTSNTGARLLENPLFYAAKYGNFDDQDSNTLPNTNAGINANPEWDNVNLEGQNIPDGLPDNYFPVSNPALLKEQLGRVFARVAATQASGTSAAVVSSTGEGSGAVFQATYSEETVDQTDPNRKIKWTGSIRGLWVTPAGELAEDTNQNAEYDEGADLVIEFEYDRSLRRTLVRRGGSLGELSALRPIWDAGTQLARAANGNLLANRDYSGELAQDKRYITTWLDSNKDGLVGSGEQIPFIAGGAGITATNYKYLNTCSLPEANRLVNWIRGVDQPGVPAVAVPPAPALPALRSRQIDLDANGTIETVRLGDIVNSSPLVVAKPNASLDILYRDASYTRFANTYRCRRSVVYAGANDGMIHAFNGGFRNRDGFALTPAAGCPSFSATAHDLGTELWGFVPGNLLAHLNWTADPDYTHVFYVDGNPISYDVKAFSPDSRHPNGWGTILIVPFRLGGGPISVPTGADSTLDHKSAPAFVVFDVTDPEIAPTLIAEIVLPNSSSVSAPFGTGSTKPSFSYSQPTIAFDIDLSSGVSEYQYRLVFGTGPTKLNPEVHSDQSARIFTYDLNAIIGGSLTSFDTDSIPGGDTFVSDLNSADFDFGGTTDAVYFGTNQGVPNPAGGVGVNSAMTGRLYKYPFESTGGPGLSGAAQPGREFSRQFPVEFYNPGAPIQGKPALTLSSRRLPAVAFGTGRMLSKGDFNSTQPSSLYILDDGSSFTTAPFSGVIGSDAVAYRTLDGVRGLQIPLTSNERSFTSPTVFRGIGIFTSFKPESDQCFALGQSSLYQVNFANARADEVLGSTGVSVTNLGDGAASNPRVFVSPPPRPNPTNPGDAAPGGSGVTIITQDSTGRLSTTDSIDNDFGAFGEQTWWEPRED
jgi:type IV pilus assembly protein PilY1